MAPNRGKMKRLGDPKGHQIGTKSESKKRHEKKCVKQVLGRTEPAPAENPLGIPQESTEEASGGVWGSPNPKLKLNF